MAWDQPLHAQYAPEPCHRRSKMRVPGFLALRARRGTFPVLMKNPINDLGRRKLTITNMFGPSDIRASAGRRYSRLDGGGRRLDP